MTEDDERTKAINQIADSVALRVYSASLERPTIARQPEPGNGDEGFLTRVAVESNRVVAPIQLELHPPDDAAGAVLNFSLLSSRAQSVVERRVGMRSQVRFLLSGGSDFEDSVERRYFMAMYDPATKSVHVRDANRRDTEEWLVSELPHDSGDLRRRLEELRDSLATLIHEHVHAVADTHDALVAWGSTNAGFVFLEGTAELAANLMRADVVAEAGLTERFPGLEHLPPGRDCAIPMAAAAEVILSLAELAGIDGGAAVLTIVREGGGLTGLSRLVVNALVAQGIGAFDLAPTTTGILTTLTSEFDDVLDRLGQRDPTGITVADGTAAGRRVIAAVHQRLAQARPGWVPPSERGTALDKLLGSGSSALLQLDWVPCAIFPAANAVAVVVLDVERPGLDDDTVGYMIAKALDARGPLPPGSTLLWSDLRTREQVSPGLD